MPRPPRHDPGRGAGLLACLACLLGLLTGCQSECQRLCDRMADRFARCGLSVTQDDLTTCYAEQASASEVEERLCTAQTRVVLDENLRIRGGGDSSCLALEPYGATTN